MDEPREGTRKLVQRQGQNSTDGQGQTLGTEKPDLDGGKLTELKQMTQVNLLNLILQAWITIV